MNVLAFIQLLVNEFTWETLMIDPFDFVLWGFVAVSIILGVVAFIVVGYVLWRDAGIDS